MSCTTSSDPTARDFFAGGVDSYLDTITKYAGIGGTEPKLPGYAKLGSATTVINMAKAAGQHDYGEVAKAYSAGVAAYVVGDVAFTALAGIAIAAGGGVLAIGTAFTIAISS